MTILRDITRPKPANFSERGHRGKFDASKHDAAYARRLIEEDRFGRLFIADWKEVVFLHFEVEPDLLQRVVPIPLDLREGRAFVSLVAFTLRGMRLSRGGIATRWLTAPIATHQFFNLRTYVRFRGEAGIYFMSEWLNNRLAVALGPGTYGLPYRNASIKYTNTLPAVAGEVATDTAEFRYHGKGELAHQPVMENSLDEFLVERYTAYAGEGGTLKRFRIWHEPWRVNALHEVEWQDDALINGLGAWTANMNLVGAHQSAGVKDVWMGPPVPVQ